MQIKLEINMRVLLWCLLAACDKEESRKERTINDTSRTNKVGKRKVGQASFHLKTRCYHFVSTASVKNSIMYKRTT